MCAEYLIMIREFLVKYYLFAYASKAEFDKYGIKNYDKQAKNVPYTKETTSVKKEKPTKVLTKEEKKAARRKAVYTMGGPSKLFTKN